ncbi:MAG: DNA methyltransferase, partial [Eubacteriales bacterium]
FLGSGTTSVVAKKLNRHYIGIEIEPQYCVWAEQRLKMAENNSEIQGYVDGVFWERNSLPEQNTTVSTSVKQGRKKSTCDETDRKGKMKLSQKTLFDFGRE